MSEKDVCNLCKLNTLHGAVPQFFHYKHFNSNTVSIAVPSSLILSWNQIVAINVWYCSKWYFIHTQKLFWNVQIMMYFSGCQLTVNQKSVWFPGAQIRHTSCITDLLSLNQREIWPSLHNAADAMLGSVNCCPKTTIGSPRRLYCFYDILF